MKFRSTLILLGVCVALAAYILLVERHRKTTGESLEQATHVVQLDRDKINAISIKNPEAEITLQKRDNNQWYLDKPVKDRADSGIVTQLLTAVETLRSDATIDADGKGAGKEQLKDFGVTDTNTKLKLNSSDGKPVELAFGKDAAVEGKLYVRVEGSDKVYVIGNDLKNQISKKADDFRDRKLTDLTTQQVSKVAIKSQTGDLELDKKNTHWSISKPLQARGDDSKINDLVAQAATAHIDQFIADSNLATYGLDQPKGSIAFTVEGSEKPVELQLGANPKDEKDKEKVYAKLSTRDAIVLLPKSVEALLTSKPNDLRDKNLLRVESDIVDRMTIESVGQEKLVIARKGESWVRKEGDKELPINAASAAKLLSDLQNATVANFVSDAAADLPKYGLDQPKMKVTLSSYASQNTAETQAGEKPIVTVLFGNEEGGNVYAKLDTEPFIVAVSAVLVNSIPRNAVQWQDLTIYKFKPEDLAALEVSNGDQPAISLERDKDKGWKLAKGDGAVNQGNVQKLVATLASLNAVRWAGPTAPEHGLDKPSLTVRFSTGQGEKKSNERLILGAPTADDAWNASADGRTGTFVVSRPDHDALAAALLEKPAQQAQPTAAPQQPAPAPVTTTAPVEAPAAAQPAAPTTSAAPVPAAPASPASNGAQGEETKPAP